MADVGFQDQSFSGTGTPTGTKRAESYLWWNDGFWWADMWSTASGQFRIFKLNTGTQTWSDTGTALDTRSNTHADVLWDGVHLYVASHLFVNDEQAAVAGFPSYLFRYSYNPLTDSYSRDSGFPVTINNYKTETLAIDRDSTGKLWATWQQGNKIYVNRTLGSDTAWGTPFVLPVANTSVQVDDNSAVIAFEGNKIGVMWSNETSSVDGMYFAVHNDGDPDTTWQPSRAAAQGGTVADDHINLKALTDGRVLAATKTGYTSSSQPLTQLLVRDPATGNWSHYTISTVSVCPNRPLVLVDTPANVIHVLETEPAPPTYSCNSSGGAIYEKTSPLNSISFPSGRGTLVILDSDSAQIHNVTSTKQNISSTTGLAALAVNSATKRYWHYFNALSGAPPDTTPPDTIIDSGPSGTVGDTSATFTFHSTEPDSTLRCSLDGAGFTACISPQSYSGLSLGAHNFQVRAIDAAGNVDPTPASRNWTVNDTTPPTVTSVSPTDGTSGVAVNTNVRATFSEDVNAATVTTSTFLLTRTLDSATVTATVSYDGATRRATLDPSADLLPATSYTATVTTGVTDQAGNALAADEVWSFTTGITPPPTTGITRESTTTAVNSTATSSVAIAKPFGTTAGDVLVSCLALNGSSVAGAPAGWTPIASVTSISNPHVFGYYRVAGSFEPDSYTWTLGSTVTNGGGIARYSGVDNSTPLDAAATTASGAASTSGTVSGISTASANAMLVGCMAINSSNTGVTIASPTGMSEAWDIGGKRHELADGAQASAGASGDKTWTFSSAREWAGWLSALRPQ